MLLTSVGCPWALDTSDQPWRARCVAVVVCVAEQRLVGYRKQLGSGGACCCGGKGRPGRNCVAGCSEGRYNGTTHVSEQS